MNSWRTWKSLQETMEEEYSKHAAKENRTANREFVQNTVKRLESIISLDLEDLELGLRVYRENYSHPEGKFWKMFEFLMNSLDTMNLPDTTTAAELLRLAYYSMYFEESSLPRVLTHVIRESWDVCISHKCYMLINTEFQMLLKVPYSGPYDWVRNHIYAHQVVWHVITEGKEKILSSLLRYGIMFVPIPDDKYYVSKYLLYSNRNKTAPGRWTRHLDRDSDFRVKRMWIVTRVMKLLAVELETKSRTAGSTPEVTCQRLSSYSVQYVDDGSLSRSVYFRCLQRTFETIPEPFVSSEEIRKFLREMCGEHLDEESDRHIDRLISEFEDVYPEGAAILAPRSLKHLSRCQVREELRQSGTLPHGVRDLGLPRNIEKYIILE